MSHVRFGSEDAVTSLERVNITSTRFINLNLTSFKAITTEICSNFHRKSIQELNLPVLSSNSKPRASDMNRASYTTGAAAPCEKRQSVY